MANTFIQGKNGPAGITGATYSLAYNSNVTVGNLLIAEWGHLTSSVSSVTDSLGVNGNWNVVYDTSDGAGYIGGWAWMFTKASGACTVNVNLAASSGGGRIEIAEENGPTALRATAAANVIVNGTAQPSNSNTVSATAGDWLIGFFSSGTGNTLSAAPPWVLRAQSDANPNALNAMQDTDAAGGSTFTSFNGSSTNARVCGLGAFYAATFNISGGTGVAGATVNYSGPASGSVTADGSGN